MSGELRMGRRGFLVQAAAVGGGMMLSVAPAAAKKPAGAAKASAGPSEVSPWVVIGADDTVTIYVPTPEIGNGAMTMVAMIVAEELNSAWAKTSAEWASPTKNFLSDDVYGKSLARLGFFGGRSTDSGRMRALRQAGASARERLKAAAGQVWKAPASEIEASESVLTHRPTGRTLRYGEVAARAATIKLAKEPALKPESEWRLLGKVEPGKLTNAAVVTGAAIYGMDVRQPNMLYAALRQSPVHGGKLKSYDFGAIRNMPGVHSVVVVDPSEPRAKLPFEPPLPMAGAAAQSGVAVLATHYWQAQQALDKLPIVWEDGPTAQWKSTEQINQAAFKACAAPGAVVKKSGDAVGRLAQRGKTVTADYLTPFCEHATLEPLNGTALYTPDRLDVWQPTQMLQLAYCVGVEESGLSPEKVFVHQTMVGGGFGRRTSADDVRMVVAIARKVPGRPVHVIWSREEQFRQGRYRALAAAKITARLDSKGMPSAWLARAGYVGRYSPRYFGDNPYIMSAIPDVLVETTALPVAILSGPYRGPGYNSNAFFVESFIDECAAAAGADPMAYRLKLLANWPDPGWVKCLEAVRAESGWGGKLARGQGRGVAICNWPSEGKPKTGTTVAAVARVEVSKAGELRVQRLDVAFDCGRVLSRDAVLAQIEGGSIFGLNMAMNEALTVENGRIVEGNFHEYPMLRLSDIPELHVHFTGLSGDERFSEVGEPGVGPIGPAIANAIYAATGKRIRQTPFRKQDLSWA